MTQYQASLGIITSVTQCDDPLHNALAERLNGTIKNDWLHNYEEMSFEETKASINRAIQLYNTARPHRALGMKTPMQAMNATRLPQPTPYKRTKERSSLYHHFQSS